MARTGIASESFVTITLFLSMSKVIIIEVRTLLPASQTSLHTLPHLRVAQEIRLAKRHTLLPQNVVSSRDVEEEVGDGPVRDVNSSRELERISARNGNSDLDLLLALEVGLLALGIAEELEGACDAVLELVHCDLVVFNGHPLVASDAVEHGLGDVAGELDLELQRLHVVDESGVDQLLGGNIVLLGPLLGLLKVVGELGQAADEERDACCCC